MEKTHRVLLFIDIVESVRLVEQDEDGTILRWLRLSGTIQTIVTTRFHGVVVKQTGDGFLMVFPDVRAAVAAAFAIQLESEWADAGTPAGRRILLRFGIESSEVIVVSGDVFGRGVNTAARLMSIAKPGEVVLSATAREQITAAVDADIEDLGDCYLRHTSDPVRAFRASPPGTTPGRALTSVLAESRPTVAVMPFEIHGTTTNHVLGEVLADEIIRSLSRSQELNVISRLSSSQFSGRGATLADVAAHLRADYLLSATCRLFGDAMVVDAEFIDIGSGHIAWSDRITDHVADIVRGESTLVHIASQGVTRAMMTRELQRARSQPLVTLKNYTLLFAAISLMHRLTPRDFNDAREMLQTIIDRGFHQPIPHAWMAKWHVLRVAQGWSQQPEEDGKRALAHTARSLEADPDLSLALAMEGFVQTNIFRRLDIARERYDRAIDGNPNDAMALLLRGMLNAFSDDGVGAVRDTELALVLTPLDPHRYFYESLAASANVTAGRYERALGLAKASLRGRRTHTSTWRALTVAQWQLGLHDDARASVQELLNLDPAFTVTGYLRQTPSADFRIGKIIADVLASAGAPR